MMNGAMQLLILLSWMAGISSAEAENVSVLKGPDIISVLSGKTIRGAYADGTSFTETFWPDGKDSYWDPRGTSTGHWSVAQDLMCFEYDPESNMIGGCFRVEKTGANCFDFYVQAQAKNGAAPDVKKPRYVARASADGADGTCPVDLQV
jgi:hypothetical protein